MFITFIKRKMKKNFLIIFLFLFQALHSINKEQAIYKLAKEFNCKENEILNAFESVAIYFKAHNILDGLKSNNFYCVKINDPRKIESEIVSIINSNNEYSKKININVNDLKDHSNFRMIYNNYLKNCKNALFYLNPFLKEALLLSICKEYIIFSFLKFNSYYADANKARLVKEIYLKFFFYERTSGKVTDY